jgi:hypothetical protein
LLVPQKPSVSYPVRGVRQSSPAVFLVLAAILLDRLLQILVEIFIFSTTRPHKFG